MAEFHLFILWEKARYREAEILVDIEASFELVSRLDILWPKESYASNLSRFYGENLPDRSFKEKHCGNGRFLALIVRDNNPVYGWRKTSKGPRYVNTVVFDKKIQYRKLTGGGHKIHASNDVAEFNHDLTLLLGVNAEDFPASPYYQLEQDCTLSVPGFGGWQSFDQLLYVLNNTLEYVVLRNFEPFPALPDDAHPDIDLLVSSEKQAAFILNADKKDKAFYRSRYHTLIAGKPVDFDLRVPGDGYYCEAWQRDMLKSRAAVEWGYVPEPESYRYALLYHALIHKREVSPDYRDRLQSLFSRELASSDEPEAQLAGILARYMRSHNYRFTAPRDYTVYYNQRHAPELPVISIRRLYQMMTG